MSVQVLGAGCYKCVELEMLLASMLAELHLTDAQVMAVAA